MRYSFLYKLSRVFSEPLLLAMTIGGGLAVAVAADMDASHGIIAVAAGFAVGAIVINVIDIRQKQRLEPVSPRRRELDDRKIIKPEPEDVEPEPSLIYAEVDTYLAEHCESPNAVREGKAAIRAAISGYCQMRWSKKLPDHIAWEEAWAELNQKEPSWMSHKDVQRWRQALRIALHRIDDPESLNALKGQQPAEKK